LITVGAAGGNVLVEGYTNVLGAGGRPVRDGTTPVSLCTHEDEDELEEEDEEDEVETVVDDDVEMVVGHQL
jgi:hypothetical protein